jgi:hypothetical protein
MWAAVFADKRSKCTVPQGCFAGSYDDPCWQLTLVHALPGLGHIFLLGVGHFEATAGTVQGFPVPPISAEVLFVLPLPFPQESSGGKWLCIFSRLSLRQSGLVSRVDQLFTA